MTAYFHLNMLFAVACQGGGQVGANALVAGFGVHQHCLHDVTVI